MKARKGSLGKTTRPSVAGVLPRKRLFGLLTGKTPVSWMMRAVELQLLGPAPAPPPIR